MRAAAKCIVLVKQATLYIIASGFTNKLILAQSSLAPALVSFQPNVPVRCFRPVRALLKTYLAKGAPPLIVTVWSQDPHPHDSNQKILELGGDDLEIHCAWRLWFSLIDIPRCMIFILKTPFSTT